MSPWAWATWMKCLNGCGRRGFDWRAMRCGRGAGGHRYFFVHPASTGGVLMEIVGDAEGKD